MTNETPAPDPAASAPKDAANIEVAERATTYLREIRSAGPWTLTSIHNGVIHSETFSPKNLGEMKRWIRDRNTKINLYWHINPTYGNPGNKSALEDVSHLEQLHVDIDPDHNSALSAEAQRKAILALLRDEARLQNIGLPGKPTSVVDSGGGYWAFWGLIEPHSLGGGTAQERRDAANAAGGYNKWLGQVINKELGMKVADDCHNLDRVARLPFTLNIPTAKKKARGRVACVSAVADRRIGVRYALDQFQCVEMEDAGPCKEAVNAVKIEGDGAWEPLPKGDAWAAVQELCRRYPEIGAKNTELILLGGYLHPEGEAVPTKTVDGQEVIDRNGPFHRVNRHLQRCGVPKALVIEVLSDPRFAVSEHARFPANKDGKVSRNEVRGAELYRFVSGQVKKAAAKLTKEAFDARQTAKTLDEAGVNRAEAPSPAPESSISPGGPSSSGGNGAAPPPPPPPPPGGNGAEPPDDGGLPFELRFQHGPGTTANPVGAPLKNEHNILVALRRLGVMLSYNRFADQMLVGGLEGFGPELDDHAVVSLRLTIDRQFGFLPNKDYFYDVLANAALANSFHPIFDYFDTLSWDRQPRLDKWLTTYSGAKDTPYTNAAGRLMLLAAVRRLRRPGCKFDEMLVLEGPQGTNKSSALKLLAVNDDWFLDDLPLGAASKDMIEQMTGKWIVEIADLHKKQKTDVNKIKAQLSRTEDRARLAYGRLAKSVRRSCVFFGTTNEDKYLEDPTGERRFWPIFTQRFDLEMLAHDRDQLWAEAVEMEARGESIRMDASLWTEAAIEQSQRSIVDPWYEHLDELLGEMNGKILNSDVWRLVGLTPDKMKRTDTIRIATVMKQLGFVNSSLRFNIDGVSKKHRGYVRGEAEARERQLAVRVTENSIRIIVTNVSEVEEPIPHQEELYHDDVEQEVPF